MEDNYALVVLGQRTVEWAASPWRTVCSQRVEQTKSSRDQVGYGRRQCQHRWRRRSTFPKEKEVRCRYHEKVKNNTFEHLCELKKILDGQMGRLKKNHMCQTEANDKVWDLNRKTERIPETWALLCTRFDQYWQPRDLPPSGTGRRRSWGNFERGAGMHTQADWVDDHGYKRDVDWHRRQEREQAGLLEEGPCPAEQDSDCNMKLWPCEVSEKLDELRWGVREAWKFEEEEEVEVELEGCTGCRSSEASMSERRFLRQWRVVFAMVTVPST